MTRIKQADIPASGLRTMNVGYRQTGYTQDQYVIDAQESPRYVERSSRAGGANGTRTTGARYPIPNTNTGTQRRNPSTNTGQQPCRTTGGDKVFAAPRKTEKLRGQHHTRNFVLTIIGMTMLCMLCAGIIFANINAAWQNSQDAGYFTQTAHRDYAQIRNAQVWAFMAGNQIDVLILKNNDMSHARVLVIAQVLKDADHTNLELVSSNDGKSVLLTEKGEHVGGLTFQPSQYTQAWKIDVEKEAVK